MAKLSYPSVRTYRKDCSYNGCDNKPTISVMVNGIITSVCFDHCVITQKVIAKRSKLN